jgi:hypothetical protein
LISKSRAHKEEDDRQAILEGSRALIGEKRAEQQFEMNTKDYARSAHAKPPAEDWGEEQEDDHVRNLYKADKLMGDILFRHNMFALASQHYAYLNK